MDNAGADALPLPPRVDPPLADVVEQPDFLHGLVRGLGSPLNVVLPERIGRTVEAFRAVYHRHGLRGRTFFAHKANRSAALIRSLAAGPAGIDVASLGELQHALGAGFRPDRILATGPKSREFLWLAARCQITVNLDSVAELADLTEIVRAHGWPPVDVLIRLSQFTSTGTTVLSRPSRFGTAVSELDAVCAQLRRSGDAVRLVGLAFHLDTVGQPEKVAALKACLTGLATAYRHGLRPDVIDIGGGFGVNYLSEPEQWQRWTSELALAVLGRRSPLTWGGHGYGWRVEGGRLRGALGLYPASRPSSGPRYLDDLLAGQAGSLGQQSLGALLQDSLVELWTEPGRALVDQCGLVLARVLEVRACDDAPALIRLELNASDVSVEEHGVMMDPILIPQPGAELRSRGPKPAPPAYQHSAYLLGNLCLEADLITRRQVFLPTLPEVGDLLAFVNTAGYLMDFHADQALQHRVAPTVAAWTEDGRWRWCLDELYWPAVPTKIT